ncbi:hypothetical protein FPSE_09333 [Fusarium pseudograminearum CS3096]|uniref:Uncharacterized protein n=1 Tax=Fusarium pseudograminearum (strain CS3096) TaxID=1028729 RepID=K3V9S3_FUSPC|nr:hypothetical protein FPSE_09333 [Fusarium pseudograminearum CS3096]EKJ70472.1 hypothetical protein FPSE_09333 [Fusarium pseudograminearum CS3096]KAF0634910.1 hypothetical protein FPSE5266_09333 [Fusarium pseudograminearum]
MVLIPQRRALLALQNDLTQFGGHVHALAGTVIAGQAYLAVEHNVNGLWNAILHILYPVADMDFLINPEAYPLQGQQNGARADLIVREINVNPGGAGFLPGRTFMYFEGKGGASADTALNIRTQMVNYLNTAIGNAQGRACWAIGAKGDRVWFYRYTARHVGDNRMVPVDWNGIANAINSPNVRAGQMLAGYRISGGVPGAAVGDWATVQSILEHMSQSYADF